MAISTELKKELAEKIVHYIQQDFATIYVSHSLADTVKIIEGEDGKITVEVPAPIYDTDLYKAKKQIVYTGTGSYAYIVDAVTGGYSGKHKDYIARAIQKAIAEWMAENNIQGRLG